MFFVEGWRILVITDIVDGDIFVGVGTVLSVMDIAAIFFWEDCSLF